MEGIEYALAPFILSSRSAGGLDERYRLWFIADAAGIDRIYQPYNKEATQRLSNDKTFWQANPWDETEPVVRSLDDGLPSCVGIYRGFGNAINVQVAKELVAAYMECQSLN